MTLEVGDTAPDFSLPATGPSGGAKPLSLKSLRGKKVILYFYPKDDTPGCTAEACGFRDALSDFAKSGAEVVGVSRDSLARHEKFRGKYDLPFRLVSDEDGKLCEAYGVWTRKSFMGRKFMGIERSTFLIDEKGKIRHIWRKVKVKGHVEEVLEKAKG
jgi:peroxiredoxin Q/BCP